MKKMKAMIAVMLAWIMAVSAFGAVVRAAEEIDLERDVVLEIHHSYDGMPIPGALFRLYRVADVDPYQHGGFILNETFSKYPIELDGIDQEDWAALALTLKGYVLRDGIESVDQGETGEDGILVFPNLQSEMKPGLYLVIGDNTELDGHIYSSVPFLAALPVLSEGENEWLYHTTVQTKTAQDIAPTTLRVLKIWNDAGFQSMRPQQITVTLLCDGQIYDTVVLNESNGWRHVWNDLDPHHDWTIVEDEIENYTVVVEQDGVTFVITNKYKAPVITDPPVAKIIAGDRPDRPHTFTFIMTALDSSYPMPQGSVNGVKTVTIMGEGWTEFGDMFISEPGVYVYNISEKFESVSGYTFDSTVYELTFIVTETDGVLRVERTIKNNMGVDADNLVFTNHYKKPGSSIPQTGMLWWPIVFLSIAGLIFMALGVISRKKSYYEE